MKKGILLTALLYSCFSVNAQESYEQPTAHLPSSIDSLVQSGLLDEAENHLQAYADENSTTYKEYLFQQGEILLRKGRHDLAGKRFDTALKQYETLGDDYLPQTADCYDRLGLVYWATGNLTLSLQHHFKALEIRKAHFGDEHPIVAASYNNIGLTYSNNDREEALDYYEKALLLYEKELGKNHDKTANAYINIGIMYEQMELYGSAIEELEKALNIERLLRSEEHPKIAFVLSSLGSVHESIGNYTKALKYQNDALEMYKNSYGLRHPEIAGTCNLIGNIHAKQKKYNLALKSYQQAIMANSRNFSEEDIYTNPPAESYFSADILLTSMLSKARVFEELHFRKTLKYRDLKASFDTFVLCDGLIDKVRNLRFNEADKLALDQQATSLYEDALRLSLAMSEISLKRKEYLEKAFYFNEKSKASVLLGAISDAKAKSFAQIPPSLLERETDLRSTIAYNERLLASKPQAELAAVAKEKLLSYTSAYKEFVSMLETDYPQYYTLKYDVDIPSISTLQAQLDDSTAMVSYFDQRKNGLLTLFVITKDDFKIIEKKKNPDYERYLSGFRNSILYDVPSIYVLTGHALYRQLLPKKLPKPIKKLVIVPTGRMSTLPFSALLTQKFKDSDSIDFIQLPYLLKDYSISYINAAERYHKVENSKDRNSKHISLFTPVHFTSTDGRYLPDLPASLEEAEKIDAIFQKKQWDSHHFSMDMAAESIVKSGKLKEFDYIHFSTHGIVDEEKPSLSRIYLHTTDDGSLEDDGRLYTGELYNLELNADLVTLSACQTGLGKVSMGEGIVGLSRALIYAGADNLLVSLWKVADQSTAKLMVDFYEQVTLSDTPTVFSSSLRKAKLHMINKKENARPFHWASFVLIGQ